jgi:hypothetical protein
VGQIGVARQRFANGGGFRKFTGLPSANQLTGVGRQQTPRFRPARTARSYVQPTAYCNRMTAFEIMASVSARGANDRNVSEADGCSAAKARELTLLPLLAREFSQRLPVPVPIAVPAHCVVTLLHSAVTPIAAAHAMTRKAPSPLPTARCKKFDMRPRWGAKH